MLVRTLRPDLFDEDTDRDCQTPTEKTDLALQICSIHFSIQVNSHTYENMENIERVFFLNEGKIYDLQSDVGFAENFRLFFLSMSSQDNKRVK